MLKKILIFIAVFIIVAVLGYFGYQYFTQPQEPKDENSILLENLEQETGINFSKIKNVEFKWIVAVDPEIAEETIAGKVFEVKRISSEQFDSIQSFFINNGFEMNIYNMVAGTVSGLTGHVKDQTVCTIAGGFTGYQEAEGQWIPPETDKYDITIRCGKL